MLRRWSFSILLGIAYPIFFYLWMSLPRFAALLLTVLGVLFLCHFFAMAAGNDYFLNRWDALGHGVVILDLFLEGILISEHADFGFHFCWLGFAVVVGGYRAWQLSRLRRYSPSLEREAVPRG